VELENETRDKVERFWSDLLAGVTDLVRDAGCEKTPIVVKGGFIFKAKAAAGATNDLVSQMKELLNKSPENTYLNEVFEPAKAGASEASPEDMLDFIAFDWEERNKELETHVRKLVETNQELNRLNWGTLNALARTIDAKSPWTAGHSERVTRFALLIGSKLNLGDPELEQLRRGALLHDIGKIAISRDILDKPGKLTDREYKIICEHPARGARILEPIESYADIIAIVKQHHEWFNGQGYPNKIAGETIALGARILAVADVYDALTSERPYRSGMSHDRAAEIIIKGKGTQFDPMVVEAFLQVTATDNIVRREDRSAPIDSPRATGPDHWSYPGPHRPDLTDSSPR
jgi:putative nucleotidyltransferase with HDIG domain